MPTHLTSHMSPSEAVRPFSPGLPSLATSFSSVFECTGEARKRSLIFCSKRVSRLRSYAVTMQDAYLDIAVHVRLHEGKGRVAEQVKELDNTLGCLEELRRVDALLGDGHIGVRLSRGQSSQSRLRLSVVLIRGAPS